MPRTNGFATNSARVRNRDELEALLAEVFAGYTTAEAIDRLSDHDVPVSDVQDMAALFDDPQVLARGMRASVEHPEIDDLELPGSPMHFSRTPATIRRHPPRFGERTTAVLREYGYTDRDLAELRRAGAIPDGEG